MKYLHISHYGIGILKEIEGGLTMITLQKNELCGYHHTIIQYTNFDV